MARKKPQPKSRPPPPYETSLTVAATVPSEPPDNDKAFDETIFNYDGIEWEHLPGLIKPLTIPKRKPSWIYEYGYRCVLLKDPSQIIFICKYCHIHKLSSGRFSGQSTSAAALHLKQRIPGHGVDKHGKIPL